MSMIYAGIMILSGLGHNVGAVVKGRYFGGFAGGYTGIVFVLIGPVMIYYLRKEIPNNRPNRDSRTAALIEEEGRKRRD